MIAEFLKRPIAYQPVLAKAFDSVKLGILWSQLYYWHDKGSEKDGWIYKTQHEIYDETGLSRKEQETARKIGRELGVLEERYVKAESRMFYRVDINRAIEVVNKFFSKTEQAVLPAFREKTPGDEAREFFELGEIMGVIKGKLLEVGMNETIINLEFTKFCMYWTEPTKSGKAQRWETEKTFDVRRRLKTWLMNTQKFNSNNKKVGFTL